MVADSWNNLCIQTRFLLMYLSSTFRTHQSHNVGQDSSKALTTLQPVIHSMWRFTYPLRPSSQGTLVSTIRERRAAAPGELYNQWRYTLVLRQLFLLPASLVMPCWLFSENTLGFLLMSVCLFVCVRPVDWSIQVQWRWSSPPSRFLLDLDSLWLERWDWTNLELSDLFLRCWVCVY